MCLNNCSCTTIVSSVGPTGAAGAQGVAGATGSQGATGAMPTTYTTSQAYTSTNDIYNGGAGYNYSISASMPAGTTAYFTITFLLSATAARTVTMYPIVNGVADTTKQFVVVMPTALSSLSSVPVTISGFVTYAITNTFQMKILADSATGTPVLKSVTGQYYTVA